MQHNITDYTPIIENLHYWIDITHAQLIDDSYIFQHKNIWYMLSDNGGETNVMKINAETTSIPHHSWSREITPLLMAYRVGRHLQGLEINWEMTDEQLKEGLNVKV